MNETVNRPFNSLLATFFKFSFGRCLKKASGAGTEADVQDEDEDDDVVGGIDEVGISGGVLRHAS